jgi:hypothetical protein
MQAAFGGMLVCTTQVWPASHLWPVQGLVFPRFTQVGTGGQGAVTQMTCLSSHFSVSLHFGSHFAFVAFLIFTHSPVFPSSLLTQRVPAAHLMREQAPGPALMSFFDGSSEPEASGAHIEAPTIATANIPNRAMVISPSNQPAPKGSTPRAVDDVTVRRSFFDFLQFSVAGCWTAALTASSS